MPNAMLKGAIVERDIKARYQLRAPFRSASIKNSAGFIPGVERVCSDARSLCYRFSGWVS